MQIYTMAETQCGFGSFKFGRLGFGDAPKKGTAVSELTMLTSGFHVVNKTSSTARFRTSKIKNVSSQIVTLQLIPDRPRNLPPVSDIRLVPNQTAEILIDAYDPEQVRNLRRQLKIIVDPISR